LKVKSLKESFKFLESLEKLEALALIEVEILFCRGSAEKIEADSRN